jgi:hypothetical protein
MDNKHILLKEIELRIKTIEKDRLIDNRKKAILIQENKIMLRRLKQFLYDISVSLPEFLYEDDGRIKIGYKGDSDVTDEWNDWKEKHMR